MKNKKILTIITLLLVMSIFCMPVFAQESMETADTPQYEDETDIELSDGEPDEDMELDAEPDDEAQESESAIPVGSGFRPFTPPGTGTVIDNAMDGDGKEFYTIGTEDGSVFYLIVDRQKAKDNVYLLNAVTLEDLIALAEKNDSTISGGTSAIPSTGESGMDGKKPLETTEPDEKPASKNNMGLYLIIIAVLGAGGALYYFKVVKGKKNTPDDDVFDDNGDDDSDGEYDDEIRNDDEFGNDYDGDEPDEDGGETE